MIRTHTLDLIRQINATLFAFDISGVAKQLEPGIDILFRSSPYIARSYLNKMYDNVVLETNQPDEPSDWSDPLNFSTFDF